MNMPSDKAVASLLRNVAKLSDRLANPPLDATDEDLAELEQSIIDLQANLDRWGSE
jgi:hypothetical protein